jgi:hypothetical protein
MSRSHDLLDDEGAVYIKQLYAENHRILEEEGNQIKLRYEDINKQNNIASKQELALIDKQRLGHVGPTIAN